MSIGEAMQATKATKATTEHKPLEKAAQLIRAITVPPVLVTALFVLLFIFNTGVFASLGELLLSLLFLVLVPAAAYPISYLIPSLRKEGREAQRQIAFYLSIAGYTGAVIYGFIAQVGALLLLIFATYFLSVLILILFNKVLKIRASGHASGSVGPLIFLVYLIGPYGLIPCILISVAVAWSSLYLKRHSVSELVLGATVSLAAFVISLFLCGLIPFF